MDLAGGWQNLAGVCRGALSFSGPLDGFGRVLAAILSKTFRISVFRLQGADFGKVSGMSKIMSGMYPDDPDGYFIFS